MVEFEGIMEADSAITDWLIGNAGTIPTELVDRVRDIARQNPSPVDRVARTAELIYSVRDTVPASLQELGAGLALLCARYSFHGLNQDNRGVRIAGALMRIAGTKRPTGMRAQDEKLDPEVAAEYQAKPEVAPPAHEVEGA